MKFTIQEKIDLILNFYTFTGYIKDNVDGFPEAIKFIESGYARLDDEYPDVYKMNEFGEEFLHDCIKEISTEFISFMKKHNNICSMDEIINWFTYNYELSDVETGKEIMEYICFNLETYGYTAKTTYSSKRGKRCEITKKQ